MSTGSQAPVWSSRTAIVISSTSSLRMHLQELLRSMQWKIVETTDKASEAITSIRQGLAEIVIIDDAVESPSIFHARQLMMDPVALCTPTLVFLLKHHADERRIFSKFPGIVVVDKPLTPNNFIPSFKKLVSYWQKPPLFTFKKVVSLGSKADEQKILPMLEKLQNVPQLTSKAAACRSLVLRRNFHFKESERVLLDALKLLPRDLFLMLFLGDFYLHSAMPLVARKIFTGARTLFGDSVAILPDLVQANLMLRDIDHCIETLQIMRKKQFMTEQTMGHLGRLLLSEGRDSEATTLFANQTPILRKIQNARKKALGEPDDLNKAVS